MGNPQAETKKTAAPPDPWREMRDVYMETWAKAMGETVKSPAYSEASGAMLETLLTTSAPFRDAQKKMMVSTLEQLNMPSRADFVSLAERLGNLELLLDDMAAKLNQIYQLASNAASQPAPATQSEAPKVEPGSPKSGPVTKSVSSHRVPAKTAKKRSK